MTSKDIFGQVNPQAMFQQEQQQKLTDAQTGLSKQQIVSMALAQRQQGQAPQQPMGGEQQSKPNGWGRTS